MAVGEVHQQHAMAAGICGIFILLCGLGDSIAGIVWIANFATFANGSGLWSGVVFIVTGVLGIVTWTKRNRGAMIAFLVLCIISCIVGTIQALVAGIVHAVYVAFTANTRCSKIGSSCTCINSFGKRQTFLNAEDSCDMINTLVGGLLAFIILSAFGAIFALVGSIIGCMSACGSQQTAGTVVVQQPAVVMQSYPAGYPQQPGGYPAQAYAAPVGYPQQPGGYPAQAYTGPAAGPVPPQYQEKDGTP